MSSRCRLTRRPSSSVAPNRDVRAPASRPPRPWQRVSRERRPRRRPRRARPRGRGSRPDPRPPVRMRTDASGLGPTIRPVSMAAATYTAKHITVPRVAAACRSLSKTSSMPFSPAAFSRTGFCACAVASAATRSWSPSHASGVAFAPLAAPGAWPRCFLAGQTLHRAVAESRWVSRLSTPQRLGVAQCRT